MLQDRKLHHLEPNGSGGKGGGGVAHKGGVWEGIKQRGNRGSPSETLTASPRRL